jgi:hypothetical protein
MATTPQNKGNHVRLDPSFHFTLLPLSAIVMLWSAAHAIRHHNSSNVLQFLVSFLLVWTAFKARGYALRVQDRLIRLEERLRLATLLPAALQLRIEELTESQLIALRFASDGEVSTLVVRALNEKLTSKQIKDAIQNWRADYFRV